MNLPEIIYQGSVKNLRGNPGETTILFEFSDHYSVFDWGKMPDRLKDKGKSLAHIGAMLFEFLGEPGAWLEWKLPPSLASDRELHEALAKLCEQGVNSHFLKREENLLQVERVNVIHPEWNDSEWNYSSYKKRPSHCLVPLEIIFRHGIPQGSSLVKRLRNNPQYGRDIGLAREVHFGDQFDTPLIEFSTKLEPSDRFLSYLEAKKIAGMNSEEFAYLKALSTLISLRLKDLFHKIGIELWDGKLEFSFTGPSSLRDFKLVDSIGPDELRLIDQGAHISKEPLRQFYIKTNWYQDLVRAKNKALKENSKAWKEHCAMEPPHVSPELKNQVENMYRMVTNKLALALHKPRVFDMQETP